VTGANHWFSSFMRASGDLGATLGASSWEPLSGSQPFDRIPLSEMGTTRWLPCSWWTPGGSQLSESEAGATRVPVSFLLLPLTSSHRWITGIPGKEEEEEPKTGASALYIRPYRSPR
jgi:hypothetical protein